jgi:hypothetical protein
MIGGGRLAPFFGVEPCGNLGGADQQQVTIALRLRNS